MSKAKKAEDKQILELSVALEITKFQRDAHREQIAKLERRLADADRRAERAEQRLHETTLMLSNLALQSVTGRHDPLPFEMTRSRGPHRGGIPMMPRRRTMRDLHAVPLIHAAFSDHAPRWPVQRFCVKLERISGPRWGRGSQKVR